MSEKPKRPVRHTIGYALLASAFVGILAMMFLHRA